jgi:hypothetical protein
MAPSAPPGRDVNPAPGAPFSQTDGCADTLPRPTQAECVLLHDSRSSQLCTCRHLESSTHAEQLSRLPLVLVCFALNRTGMDRPVLQC